MPLQGSTLFKQNDSNDISLQKLSPDLRDKALSGEKGMVTVCALLGEGHSIEHLMARSVRSRRIGRLQWETGEIAFANLEKLAGARGVVSVFSMDTYQPVKSRSPLSPAPEIAGIPLKRVSLSPGPSVETVQVKNIHNVEKAWQKGYTGSGVTVAVVDTGVDFGHPDLQGTQSRITSGDYAGWPFSYETLSGFNYALSGLTIGPDNYWNVYLGTYYSQTLPIDHIHRKDGFCTGTLTVAAYGAPDPISLEFRWPDRSKSGNYRYSVHPDYYILYAGYLMKLGYASSFAPPFLLVTDETTAGIYDTVYVDMDFDGDFSDEKPMRKGDELAGADLFDEYGDPGTDGTWDLSAGMLTWISDGIHTPPGVNAVYPDQAPIPKQGEMICFVCDAATHGTGVAGDVSAQGVITDPAGQGAANPLFAGSGDTGGVGGSVLRGMAPDASIAAFQNGFRLPYDSFTLAALGFDGKEGTGDEAQIVNNSWGDSSVIADGWDATSRFVFELNRDAAPNLAVLFATGNGGSGYGTVTSPNGGSIIGVGACTSFGNLLDFGLVCPCQFNWGDVIFWSNRGPGAAGDIAPDIVAVGASGSAPYPLNRWLLLKSGSYFVNGESAYRSFGGTSMACPVSAGILALATQAFHETNGRFPDWREAKSLLSNGARDLSYEVLVQGSGKLDADRSTDAASGKTWSVTPVQWVAGDYRGEKHEAFPAILKPGQNAGIDFNIANPTTETINIHASDFTLQRIHETSFDLTITTGPVSLYYLPSYVMDITSEIEKYDPDLLRVQVVFPFSDFNPNGDLTVDNAWQVMLLDWTDWNGDGNLWEDLNGNGIMDATEIDFKEPEGALEYNRFSYSDPVSDYLETSVGRDSLSRRHDGVFLGFQRILGNRAGNCRVRLSFYRHTDWDWIALSPETASIPPGGNQQIFASIQVPAGARFGVFQGKIMIGDGTSSRTIPVLAHVAAGSTNFRFGSASLEEPIGPLPYDNGHLLGGFDWNWRYESGDWRFFYFDVPDGSSRPGRKIVVDTTWKHIQTDVDTWIFGPEADEYSSVDPAFFGPFSMTLLGGSRDMYQGHGKFKFHTLTGGPRELISSELRDGLNLVALHNVLYAGLEHGEPFTGKVYSLETDPWPVSVTGSSGSWEQDFQSGEEITGGISVRAFGWYKPRVLKNQPIFQDDPGDPCTGSWFRSLELSRCKLLEIATSGTADMDIDLFLFIDDGDRIWECPGGGDIEAAKSTTPDAMESIRINNPPDGLYWVLVHGWKVPGTGGRPFDISIDAVQGDDLVVEGLPSGAIPGGAPVSFTVKWEGGPMGKSEARLFIDTPEFPGILEVPVHLENPIPPLNELVLY